MLARIGRSIGPVAVTDSEKIGVEGVGRTEVIGLDLAHIADRVANLLCVIAAVILVVHTFGQILKFAWGHDMMLGFVPMFSFYEEANIPTWFSSGLLLFASLLLMLITKVSLKQGDPNVLHWAGLAAVFFGLSIDEAAMVHEFAGRVFAYMAGPGSSNLPIPAWSIPFGVLTIGLGIIYCRFLLRMPLFFQRRFVLSGMLFVSGALGLEVVEFGHAGPDSNAVLFMMMVTAEELLEMFGVILFIHALICYLQTKVDILELRLTRAPR